jgi:hypothetical protein
MAVLAEVISVVIRTDALLRAFGDWDSFTETVPNNSLCTDGELARVGFMTPGDVKAYVESLAARGLVYLDNGTARDLVVVDQQRGPAAPCEWVEFGQVNLDGDPAKRVSACRLRGSTAKQIVTPDGWHFEKSLSASFGFVPNGQEEKAMTFVRREGNLEVYRSRLTGDLVYVARTETAVSPDREGGQR